MRDPRRALLLSFTLFMMLAFAISCQKSYSVGPTSSASGGGSGPSGSPPNYCATVTPVPVIPSGIYWGEAFIGASNYYGTTYDIAAVYLLVNGNPEATASVTCIGPGSSTPLTYVGNSAFGSSGVSFALYQTTAIPYQPGYNWTLKTVTSAGTAYATLFGPGGGNTATNGSQVSWGWAGNLDGVQVTNGTGTTTYQTTMCAAVPNPAPIPSSAYPSSGTYAVSSYAVNVSSNIIGGSGLLLTEEADSVYITK